MKPQKLKVEFYDGDGVRHSVTVDGPVTREKLSKLLDIVETMSGSPRGVATAMSVSPHKFDRLASMIVTKMTGREFTASDVRKTFESVYNETIPLSTVSTYLTRLSERGLIERGLEKPLLHYRLKREEDSRQLLALRQSLPPQNPSGTTRIGEPPRP